MDNGSGKLRRNKDDVTGVRAAASFRYIPEEIIVNILGRVPIESRGRFRCVSKQWYNWISHDIRTLKLMIRTVPEEFGECLPPYVSFTSMDQNLKFEYISKCFEYKYDCDYEDDWSEMKIGQMAGSCNGLILIEVLGSGFYLWNPSIDYYSQKLPLPQLDDLFHDSLDYPKYAGVLGLCFDSNNGDYKALMGVYPHPHGQVVMVGSFKTKTWTRVNFPYQIVHSIGMGVVVHDSLHLLAEKIIVCFDPKKDDFVDVPMPDGYDSYRSSKLCLLDGCLCMVRMIRECNESDNGYTDKYEVLVMKEYGVKESWTILYKIEPRVNINSTFWGMEPLFYTYDKEMVMIDVGHSILAYDTNGFFRFNVTVELFHGCYPMSASIVYEETFVRPEW